MHINAAQPQGRRRQIERMLCSVITGDSGGRVESELLDGFLLSDRRVRPVTGEVSDAHGSAHLPPKAMEVLLYLARHPRRVVARDELIGAVWGDGRGSDEALNHAISHIRNALNDPASAPEFIQTVPTRGYRLLVEPEGAPKALEAPPDDRQDSPFWEALIRHGVVQAGAAYLVVGWLLIQVADVTFETLGLPAWSQPLLTFTIIGGFPVVVLLAWFLEFAEGKLHLDRGAQSGGLFEGLGRNYLAIVAAYGIAALGAGVYQATVGFDTNQAAATDAADELWPITDDSLAVLKLVTFAGETDDALRLFAEGLSEDLIDALARLPGLKVSARGDAWSLPENATSDDVRQRLRVAHYVEGSVRRQSEDDLAVVVQLIDSATGYHVVSRRFDFALDRFGNLPRRIVDVIVANLRLALDVDFSDVEIVASGVTDVDAYLWYRRGADELDKPWSEETITAAIRDFNEALEIDANYPAAHAGLCDAHTILYKVTRDPNNIRSAEAACARAYSVGSQLPQVLTEVGMLYMSTGKEEGAAALFQRALEIDPQFAKALRGLAGVHERRLEFDEAESRLKQAARLQPGNWRIRNELGTLYFATGRYADAADEYRGILEVHPRNFAALGNLGSMELLLGDFEAAREATQRSLEIEYDPIHASNLGVIHYYLGDFDRSVEIHKSVVEAAPRSSASWVNLGDALHFSGDEAAAREAFGKALEFARADLGVRPDDPEALTYLAWSLTMTGDGEEGLRQAERAVGIDPGDPYSHYYAGLIHTQLQQYEEAFDALESAAENGYAATLLAAEPYLEPLRDNRRFKRLLRR